MGAIPVLVLMAIAAGLIAGHVMTWLDNRHFRQQGKEMRAMTPEEYMDMLEMLEHRREKRDALDV